MEIAQGQTTKNNLIELIQKHIQQYPLDSTEILDAVSTGLKLYKTAVETERDSLAYNSIDDLYALLLPHNRAKTKTNWDKFDDRNKAMYLTSSIVYNFPNGWDSSCSNHQEALLTKFCEWYFADDCDLHGSDWEFNIRKHGKYMAILNSQWRNRNEKKSTEEYQSSKKTTKDGS